MNNNRNVIQFTRILAYGDKKKKLEALRCDLNCHNLPIKIYACINEECGKTFCKDCFSTTNGQNLKCSQENCGSELKEETNIESLKELIKCIYETQGCNIKCLYKDLDEHENKCEYRLESCILCKKKFIYIEIDNHILQCDESLEKCKECGLEIKRKNYTEHFDKECTERNINCNYCNNAIKLKILDEHLLNCELGKINCDSCINSFLRKDFHTHKRGDEKINSLKEINKTIINQAKSLDELKSKVQEILIDLQLRFEKVECKVNLIVDRMEVQENKLDRILEDRKLIYESINTIKSESDNQKSILINLLQEFKILNANFSSFIHLP